MITKVSKIREIEATIDYLMLRAFCLGYTPVLDRCSIEVRQILEQVYELKKELEILKKQENELV